MNTTMIIDSLSAVQRAILANESQIESLDRAIGDGDHFINVRRGCEVLMSMSDQLPDLPPSLALQKIGMKLLGTIGGASGPLISSFFIAMGKTLDGHPEPDRRRAETGKVFTDDAQPGRHDACLHCGHARPRHTKKTHHRDTSVRDSE